MSELKFFVLILREKMLFSGEIYTTGKNFTLPLAVTALTNLTSVPLHWALINCALFWAFFESKGAKMGWGVFSPSYDFSPLQYPQFSCIFCTRHRSSKLKWWCEWSGVVKVAAGTLGPFSPFSPWLWTTSGLKLLRLHVRQTFEIEILYLFFVISCPGQLNRWHCQSVTN